MIALNINDPFIVQKMKKVTFVDIETSLIDARVFRTGQQYIGYNVLQGGTRLLTAAWGSMYDLYTKGVEGVYYSSNHFDKEGFKKNPLDDSALLATLWDVFNESDVIVAHNALFDSGWVLGRFLEMGWPLPSKCSIVCTYRGLTKFNMTSKKLDALSQTLVGAKKIQTNVDLWMRCSNGDVNAFEEMCEYNIGDIYDTLFKVYLATAQYYPDYCVDFADYSREVPLCKVTGEILDDHGIWVNRRNGLEYYLYRNPEYNIIYRDRYNTSSSKANLGLIRGHQ